jgi:tetratricopeptide (TPR) repeat protein
LAELIYGSALSESSYLEEEQAKVYRGRVGLAASSKDRETMLEYAQLVYELEVKRHSRTGKLSSMLAVAYNDLATAWAFYEEWEKSIKLLNESKRIRQSLPGFTRDMLFSPLYHLGLVLQHQGKYEEAEEVLNQAMQDREEALGTGEASMSVR